jgi:outer membrane biosynthesis protein TonB
MGVSIKQLWFSSLMLIFLGAACGKSKTADQISGFADKVCACADAACATAVQTEYLEWWKQNQRARGTEGDRKGVEKAMERYAQCHLKLVGPEPERTPVTVPKVDLHPAPAPAPTPAPAATPAPAPAATPAPKGASRATRATTEAAKGPAEATKDDPATP